MVDLKKHRPELMTIASLFRKEAVAATKNNVLGEIILIRPLSFFLLAAVSICSAFSLIVFMFCTTYTKRAQVTGLLVPDVGLINVQSPQPGIIIERLVKEGQVVKAGEVLFIVSSDTNLAPQAAAASDTQEKSSSILKSLQARQRSVNDELKQQDVFASLQSIQYAEKARAMQEELIGFEQEITTQLVRLKSAENQLDQHQQLANQNFISKLAIQQKHDEVLEQRSRLQALQRNRLTVQRELSNAKLERATSEARLNQDKALLKRQSLELNETSIVTQSTGRFAIIAPHGGVVTTIRYSVGQRIEGHALLTILPAGAMLEAQLFVRSSEVGFIDRGQSVLIRYSAYPFQKFGQYKGRVLDVSRTALAPDELPQQLGRAVASSATEGLYRVRVALEDQEITAYAEKKPLGAGMRLEADIMQDKRSLIEWAFEPIFGLKVKSL